MRAASFQGRGRTYYLDCYNSNPSSIRDSLDYFSKKFKGTPKLYALGGMEELGEKERELHRQVGATLLLESNDLVVMIGEKASWFADGIRETGARDEQMIILEDASSARALVEDFEGSVLIKGSRAYQLEQLLPTWAVPELESEVLATC